MGRQDAYADPNLPSFCRLWLIAPSTCRTIAIRRVKVLRPVGGNSTLRRCKRHPAGFHCVGEVVLHPVLDLEVSFVEGDGRWPAFRPDVSQPVRSTEFHWHKVIQFANLRFTIVPARHAQPIPAVRNMLFRLARLAVSNASSPPGTVSEDIRGHARVNSSRCASWIGNRIAAAQGRLTGSVHWLMPWTKVLRRTGDIELRAFRAHLRLSFGPFRTPILSSSLARVRTKCAIRSPVWCRSSVPEVQHDRRHNEEKK